MKRAILLLVVLLVCAVAWTLATPSTAVPVGLSVSQGGSMGFDGARLAVYADVQPGVGDVVLFDSGGTWVAHRVIGTLDFESGDFERHGWQTKGDANPKPDQWIGPDGYSTNGETLATPSNTAGVVLFWVPLRLLADLAVSAVGAVAWVALLERETPLRTPAISVRSRRRRE